MILEMIPLLVLYELSIILASVVGGPPQGGRLEPE